MYQIVKEALHTLFYDAAQVPGTLLLFPYEYLFSFKPNVYSNWSLILKVGLVSMVVHGLLDTVLV